MSTEDEKKKNIERLIGEAAAEFGPDMVMKDALMPLVLNGVPREDVEAVVEGVLGVVGTAPDAEVRARLMALIARAYRSL